MTIDHHSSGPDVSSRVEASAAQHTPEHAKDRPGQRIRAREALRRLSAAQKPSAGAPPYSRWVNRRFGRLLASVAAAAGLQPNQVTVLSACCTFSALALVALVTPIWWLGILVSLLLLLGYALDSADGQLARLLGGGSRSGEWLDHVVDATKVSVLHAVVLISFFRFTDASNLQLLVALGYQAVASMFFFGMILIDQIRRAGPSTPQPPPGRRHELLQTAVALPSDYAVLCLSFALIGWQLAFRVAYSTLFVLNALLLGASLVRWWRQVCSMDRTGR